MIRNARFCLVARTAIAALGVVIGAEPPGRRRASRHPPALARAAAQRDDGRGRAPVVRFGDHKRTSDHVNDPAAFFDRPCDRDPDHLLRREVAGRHGRGDGMTSIAALLRFAVQQTASDLHLSAGEPPMLRIHGDMLRDRWPGADSRGHPPLDLRRHERRAAPHVPGQARVRLRVRARRRCCGSASTCSCRTAAKARCSARSRRKIPQVRRPRPAPVIRHLCERGEGPRAGHRPDRQRQVDDARRDDRLPQRDDGRSHPDARGSDRVRPQAQALAGQPARGRHPDPHVHRRAAQRAARGPRRDPGRRAPRSRDDRARADRCRDRPPRVRHRAHLERAEDDRPHHRRVPARPAGADPHHAVRVAARRDHPDAAATRSAAAAPRRSRSSSARPRCAT